jgi:hypothetical protein
MGSIPLSQQELATMTPEEFIQILIDAPPTPPIFYRLYYDSKGSPVCYTMEDLPGTYVEIDQDAFHRADQFVKVRDGKIYSHKPWLNPHKLVPSQSGFPCHPKDISIAVDKPSSTKWSVKFYDPD